MKEKRSLLVIDDSQLSRDMLTAMITEKCPHITIIQATSGDEALTLLKNSQPDYVSVDGNMPGLSGIEFLEQTQTLPFKKRVLFTANMQKAMVEKASQQNAILIAKPINEDSIAKLTSYLEG